MKTSFAPDVQTAEPVPGGPCARRVVDPEEAAAREIEEASRLQAAYERGVQDGLFACPIPKVTVAELRDLQEAHPNATRYLLVTDLPVDDPRVAGLRRHARP